jgi:hypothetical protein
VSYEISQELVSLELDFVFFFPPLVLGVELRALLARQVLYHLSHSASPLVFYFGNEEKFAFLFTAEPKLRHQIWWPHSISRLMPTDAQDKYL